MTGIDTNIQIIVELVRGVLGLLVDATWPEIATTVVEFLGLHQDAARLLVINSLIQVLELSYAKLFMPSSL